MVDSNSMTDEVVEVKYNLFTPTSFSSKSWGTSSRLRLLGLVVALSHDPRVISRVIIFDALQRQ